MRPVISFGAAGAGANVGMDANADIGVGTSDDDGENDGTGSLDVTLRKGETFPRSDLLCRSPRSVCMSYRRCLSWE